jgi:hypothetical protein
MANNVIYPATSPYYNTSVVNATYLDVLDARPIPKFATDALFIVPQVYEYRPDLLAYDLYNDSRLWWVFAARNPNKLGYDPYFDFVAGLGIFIPKLSTLKQVLGI